MSLALPLMTLVIEALQPKIIAFTTICAIDGRPAVCVVAKLAQPIPLNHVLALARLSILPMVHVHLTYVWMPSVALLSVVLGWPARHPREFLRRLPLLAVSVMLLLCLDVAVQLAAQIDMLVDTAAERRGIRLAQTLLIWTDVVLETGGTWLLVNLSAVAILVGCRRRTAAHLS